jgi:hypothetical protein
VNFAEVTRDIEDLDGFMQTIKENHEGYEALGNQVVHLLTAISGELENAELNRVGEMGQKVAKLIKCVAVYSSLFLLIGSLSFRLLKKIQAAVSKRARTESQSDHTPPPTGTCDRISSLLCNAATDVIRVSADTEEIESMREELQEVIQEFNVSFLSKPPVSMMMMTLMLPHQLTAVMRTEMKVDAVRELAGRMMTRMSELQDKMDLALQDSSSESTLRSQMRH